MALFFLLFFRLDYSARVLLGIFILNPYKIDLIFLTFTHPSRFTVILLKQISSSSPLSFIYPSSPPFITLIVPIMSLCLLLLLEPGPGRISLNSPASRLSGILKTPSHSGFFSNTSYPWLLPESSISGLLRVPVITVGWFVLRDKIRNGRGLVSSQGG